MSQKGERLPTNHLYKSTNIKINVYSFHQQIILNYNIRFGERKNFITSIEKSAI